MHGSRKEQLRSYHQRHRNWCFTLFGDKEPTYNSEEHKFMCFQTEMCPKTERKHIQGYVEFHYGKSLKSAGRLIGRNPHMEPRRGTQEQAINYCSKSQSAVKDSYKEFGNKGQQGQRTDLDDMVDMINNGATSWEIIEEHRGNGLRHIGMIRMAMESKHGLFALDKTILESRKTLMALTNALPDDEESEEVFYN